MAEGVERSDEIVADEDLVVKRNSWECVLCEYVCIHEIGRRSVHP